MSDESPWTPFNPHHPIPEISHNDSSDSDPSMVMDNTSIPYPGPSMDSFSFLDDIPNFNNYGIGDWNNRAGFEGTH
jgi:hypothetical protein